MATKKRRSKKAARKPTKRPKLPPKPPQKPRKTPKPRTGDRQLMEAFLHHYASFSPVPSKIAAAPGPFYSTDGEVRFGFSIKRPARNTELFPNSRTLEDLEDGFNAALRAMPDAGRFWFSIALLFKRQSDFDARERYTKFAGLDGVFVGAIRLANPEHPKLGSGVTWVIARSLISEAEKTGDLDLTHVIVRLSNAENPPDWWGGEHTGRGF